MCPWVWFYLYVSCLEFIGILCLDIFSLILNKIQVLYFQIVLLPHFVKSFEYLNYTLELFISSHISQKLFTVCSIFFSLYASVLTFLTHVSLSSMIIFSISNMLLNLSTEFTFYDIVFFSSIICMLKYFILSSIFLNILIMVFLNSMSLSQIPCHLWVSFYCLFCLFFFFLLVYGNLIIFK